MLTTLIKLGLSEKESKVYLASLELGEETVQNIAKKAGVNRPTAYVILEKLMKMGLASSIEKGKKTLFVAENPKELENILKHEESMIDEKKVELKGVMNQLEAVYNSKQGKPIVRYFEGADGLETLDRYGINRLGKKEEYVSISPVDLIEKYFPDRRKKAVAERVKANLKSKLIYTHKDGAIPEYQNKSEMREGLFIPREQLPLSATISVYPEWGIKLYYYDELKPWGVMIENQELAKNFKLLFDLAWEGAKSRKRSQK